MQIKPKMALPNSEGRNEPNYKTPIKPNSMYQLAFTCILFCYLFIVVLLLLLLLLLLLT
jgi:cell division septal protein FtsQ